MDLHWEMVFKANMTSEKKGEEMPPSLSLPHLYRGACHQSPETSISRLSIAYAFSPLEVPTLTGQLSHRWKRA